MALEPQADFFQRQAEEKIERKKTFENFLGYFRPYRKNFITLLKRLLSLNSFNSIP